jgi:hypothetical protein
MWNRKIPITFVCEVAITASTKSAHKAFTWRRMKGVWEDGRNEKKRAPGNWKMSNKYS